MTQSQIDEFDWTRQSGGTQSGGTGPQTDHSGTGSYIYAEASPPVEAGDIAEIQTPLLTRTGISRRKLEFYYHMRGSDMGTINVYTETETARVLRWTRTGDNGDRWSLASVDLPTGTYSLVFEYIRGLDWRGDLALDDMKVILYTDVTAPTDAPTTAAAITAIPTTVAATTAAPTTVAATTAALTTSAATTAAPTTVAATTAAPTTVAATTAAPTTVAATTAALTTSAATTAAATTDGPTTVAQTATTELPSLGDILWQCTFEAGLCESTMDSSMDFEWTRLQGKTQSGLTGPSSDHTIGDTTGFYLYIEASPPRNEGDKARLVTPSITSSSEMVLTFYSHMYGATMGTLNVYRRTGSNDNLIMSLNGDRGDIWNLETAVLDPGSFSLVFEAVRGSDWSSDLAIDDITVTASPKGRADIAFVVDGSGSVGAGNFEKMKSFVRDVTNDLTIGSDAVQVAFVLFSDSSAVEFGLNAFTDKESLASAINQVIYKGGATNIASGLRSLRQDIFVAFMGDRATAPNVGILLSDGPSNWDAESTVPEAQEARATGIELFAVGVGPDADKDEMLQITNSEERVMAVSSFDTLSTMKNSIIGSTRNDENECVSSPCRNGGVCLDRLNTFVCECSSGFSGDTCEQNCVSQADVIFAIDTSGSIAVRDFRKILTFVGKVSKQLQVGQNARIGLVTFSSTAKVEFHLNEHMDIRSVLSSLDKVKYRYGATNTQAALEMMQNDMFTTDNGDREAPNVVILVTDGISTVEQENTLPNAESLKLTGAHIFVIGVGSFVDVDELSGIASSPSESNMILVTDFDALDTVVMTVAEPICTGQNSCSSSPCQNGGQCFNKVNGYTCSCPSDKGGLSCEVDCPRNIDLAFLIDESGSIGLNNFRKVMDFVMAIAKNVATGSRIGVVTFSDNAAEEFNMVKHGDKQQILDGIEAIKYSGGATHTAAGLQMLRESTFQTSNGNRNGVPDVAIVITDGISTVNEVNTGTQASLLKSIGVEVWSIGIGQIDNERQNELSEVATSDSTIKTVSDFESLQGLVNEIVSTLCSS